MKLNTAIRKTIKDNSVSLGSFYLRGFQNRFFSVSKKEFKRIMERGLKLLVDK